MGVLGIVLFVLFVVDAVLLALLVLIQDEQGDSLGGIFGGGSNTAFGASSTSVLAKLTRVLGALFLILSITVAIFLKSASNDNSVINESRTQAGNNANGEWWEADTAAPEVDLGSELIIPQS